MAVIDQLAAGTVPTPNQAALENQQSTNPIIDPGSLIGLPPIVSEIGDLIMIVYDVIEIINWILQAFDFTIVGAVISLIREPGRAPYTGLHRPAAPGSNFNLCSKSTELAQRGRHHRRQQRAADVQRI